MKFKKIRSIFALFLAVLSAPFAFGKVKPNITAAGGVKRPIYGLTLDDLDFYAGKSPGKQAQQYMATFKTTLASLPVKPTARLVFNKGMSAQSYQAAVNQIHEVSDVMALPVDSSTMKSYSLSQYENRMDDYIQHLQNVDIWEIGNEVNGDWNGSPADVVKKVDYAFNLAHSHGVQTALTLYYNVGCSNKAHDMWNWIANNLSQKPYSDMKQQLNYVFISFYPDQCSVKPNWHDVFARLHQLFPDAQLGFGEIGTPNPDTQKIKKLKNMMSEYYGLPLFNGDQAVSNYVGGYFWWNFEENMVPGGDPQNPTPSKYLKKQKQLLNTFKLALQQEQKNSNNA